MRSVQILMDEALIAAVDREARRRRSDRSKLVRAALATFLAAERVRDKEERYRRGYGRNPQRVEEIAPWETVQAWPED